ncbi:MAG TPA: GSCFA domain-containing protein, partial [Bacteroidia bacterium]|nr:GSCFA domain-containing protein [Bacteroidia bacterium]
MEFHLNYTPPRSLVDITHKDKILLIGSCFAENISEKLSESKFNTHVNPNGILFNPSSIATAITSYIKNESNPGSEINNNLHFSFDHHGSFSSATKDELVNK